MGTRLLAANLLLTVAQFLPMRNPSDRDTLDIGTSQRRNTEVRLIHRQRAKATSPPRQFAATIAVRVGCGLKIHRHGSHGCSDRRCSVRAFDDSTGGRLRRFAAMPGMWHACTRSQTANPTSSPLVRSDLEEA